MNSEKVQTIITEIISEFHSRIGGKAARKQAPVAKHQIKTLTELGIIELMPKGFGHGDARVVIEAAQDAGGKQTGGFNAYGEGDVTTSRASKLYQAINEVESQPEPPMVTVETTTESTANADEVFVGMTTIGYNTGKIFLAEGKTEQETFNNSVEAILPAGMWQHANIYDVTKRRNLEVVTLAKARQYGYRQKPQ